MCRFCVSQEFTREIHDRGLGQNVKTGWTRCHMSVWFVTAMLVVVAAVSEWHLTRWDERKAGGQPLALRRESLAMQNCRERWEDVIYGHRSLPGLLSVTALPASGCDWHLLPAPSPEKGKGTAVRARMPVYIFPFRIQRC